MGKSKIEWTDAVWNPVTGCTPISEGCQNCYAKRMATRLRGRCGYPEDEPFRVTLHPERLEEPLRWKRPRKVFVCSMGDLFHPDVPEDYIIKVFAIAEQASTWIQGGEHIFFFLTKRPKRMRDIWLKMFGRKGPIHPERLWVGVTAENQQAADERIPVLLQIPATVRFVSVEPMLGQVDLELYLPYVHSKYKEEWHRNGYHLKRFNKGIQSGVLNWVICGGETGPGARPCHPDWVRSLRDQCQDAMIPFFFKQWGEWSAEYPQSMDLRSRKMTYTHGTTFYKVGKKKAGRILDGKEWNEFPEGKVKT